MQTDLLKTKLFIPLSRPGLVLRPRLVQRLQDSLQHDRRLTLVSAPPGFGKTTLVAGWIDQARRLDFPAGDRPQFCWLSLDEADNDPVRFWRYVIAALQTALPEIGASTQAALQAPQAPPWPVILGELINELALFSEPLVLVLDEYHQVTSSQIHDGLNFILDHLPPHLHLVITTRADPPLQLSLRRGRGLLNEIRAADLRFTSQEIVEFFNEAMKLGLNAADLAALEGRTEGWAVGLQMAALSLQGVTDKHAAVEAFSGDDRYIADYLVEEVLNRQPPGVQRFLLRTSLLERLSAPLCDAVLAEDEPPTVGTLALPGSAAILDFLDRSNLFLIPLDNRRQWFRYHHLFAQLLRQKLEQAGDSQIIYRLQQRACRWYEQNGLSHEAVHLALSCRDYETAVRLMEANARDMFVLSELTTLVRWARELPDAVLSAHPMLLMAAAWASHATGHLEETRHLLHLAEAATGATVESHLLAADRLAELSPIPRAILIEVGVVVCRLRLDSGDLETVTRLGQTLLPYLTSERDGEPIAYNYPSVLRPPMVFELALADKAAGRLDEASRGFEQAVEIGRDNIHIVSLSLGSLAELEYSRHNLLAARRACQRAAEVLSHYPSPPTAFFALSFVIEGLIALQDGDFQAAESRLRSGIELGKTWVLWDSLLPGYTGLARLQHAAGDDAAAQAALDELSRLGAGNSLVQQGVMAARVELLSGVQPALPAPRRQAQPGLVEPLSQRELEVLGLLASGVSNAEIAARLVVSLNTVKKHITNIYGKMGAASRIQAVELARKLGLLQ